MAGLAVSVLGPLAVERDGQPVSVAGPRQRAVVVALALQHDRVVPVDGLVEAVWGPDAPDGVAHTLQQHVSTLRKVLAVDPALAPGTDAPLVTRAPGYLLHVDSLDADAFRADAARGARDAEAGRGPEAVAAFDDALARWRGAALADARGTHRLDAEAVRLDEERLAVVESRVDTLLATGQARELVAELEHLVAEFPLRERLWGQLMLALYRAGRQADALAAYQSARRVLVEELGLEPGSHLRELDRAIVAQRPDLELGAPPSTGQLHATYPHGSGSNAGRIELPDGQVVVLTDGLALIGRDGAALVRLVDSRVSRQHAQIETADGRSVLSDLGSTNGTRVNGAEVDHHPLEDGDVVDLGGVEVRFRTFG